MYEARLTTEMKIKRTRKCIFFFVFFTTSSVLEIKKESRSINQFSHRRRIIIPRGEYHTQDIVDLKNQQSLSLSFALSTQKTNFCCWSSSQRSRPTSLSQLSYNRYDANYNAQNEIVGPRSRLNTSNSANSINNIGNCSMNNCGNNSNNGRYTTVDMSTVVPLQQRCKCCCACAGNGAQFSPENQDNPEGLSWRRLHMCRAKLKATATTSELLSGFAMVWLYD